jgi:hypothetical protein
MDFEGGITSSQKLIVPKFRVNTKHKTVGRAQLDENDDCGYTYLSSLPPVRALNRAPRWWNLEPFPLCKHDGFFFFGSVID